MIIRGLPLILAIAMASSLISSSLYVQVLICLSIIDLKTISSLPIAVSHVIGCAISSAPDITLSAIVMVSVICLAITCVLSIELGLT